MQNRYLTQCDAVLRATDSPQRWFSPTFLSHCLSPTAHYPVEEQSDHPQSILLWLPDTSSICLEDLGGCSRWTTWMESVESPPLARPAALEPTGISSPWCATSDMGKTRNLPVLSQGNRGGVVNHFHVCFHHPGDSCSCFVARGIVMQQMEGVLSPKNQTFPADSLPQSG